MTTTSNHGQITATGRTAEMTDSEYRQAICVKYAALPRINPETTTTTTEGAEVSRQRRLAAAIVRGDASRQRGLAFSARTGA